jgi:ParB family chromosome partitioning protein
MINFYPRGFWWPMPDEAYLMNSAKSALEELPRIRTVEELVHMRVLGEGNYSVACMTEAANTVQASWLRLIARAEMRIADAIDEKQPTRPLVIVNDVIRFGTRYEMSRLTLPECRALRDAGPDAVDRVLEIQVAAGGRLTMARLLVGLAELTGENEWYSLSLWVELARAVMGSIDCNPATTESAQRVVRAETYYTRQSDGLVHEWHGNVWLNPPYTRPEFVEKLIREYEAGRIKQAIVLLELSTDEDLVERVEDVASAVVILRGQLRKELTYTVLSLEEGVVLYYLGSDPRKFLTAFNRDCLASGPRRITTC